MTAPRFELTSQVRRFRGYQLNHWGDRIQCRRMYVWPVKPDDYIVYFVSLGNASVPSFSTINSTMEGRRSVRRSSLPRWHLPRVVVNQSSTSGFDGSLLHIMLYFVYQSSTLRVCYHSTISIGFLPGVTYRRCAMLGFTSHHLIHPSLEMVAHESTAVTARSR